MSRYIDADELKRYIDDCDVCTNCKEKKLLCDIDCPMPDYLTKDWERVIDEQPTVDAVPVVRCEKCRHGIKAHGISDGWVLCSKPYVTDTVGNMMHRCDWFCADGERKEDAE